jgi:hypothetical protein
MSWLQQNKFLGTFLIVIGAATLIAAGLLLYGKSEFNGATERLSETERELNRLQGLNPFPNEANFQTLKTQTAEYGVALEKMKEELKTRVLPVTPMQPNEFQARLRDAVTRVTEKARANRVRLPEIFFLGFDEFSAALPSTEAAPLLGQQLAQVELIVDILIDARIDAITVLKRGALPEEHGASATPTPAPSRGRGTTGVANGPKLIGRSTLEVSFASSPSAARRVINQIAGASQQFYIIRTLHVMNEKDKGPPREPTAGQGGAATNPAVTGAKPNVALNFIVGNEHIQTSANIELVRFIF